MNILMMTNTYFPMVGGLEQSVYSFSEAFRSLGHEVLIVTPAFGGAPLEEPGVIRIPAFQKFGDRKVKIIRTKGGNEKIRLANEKNINVVDPKTNNIQVAEIMTVVENTANTHFVRRNIITKGAVVDTSLGKVKVTSRPGQHGMINGVLVE